MSSEQDPLKIAYAKAIAEVTANFDRARAPQVGATLPNFTLPNATDKKVSLHEILARPGTRGALITFYRGGWCPHCNRALHGLEEHIDDFKNAGVQLVAISPELPDSSLSTIEKHELKFDVLSDENAMYAEKIGLQYQMPEYLNPVFENAGINFTQYYGNEDRIVMIPSNVLVDKEGTVRNVFAEPDWTKRIDTETLMGWAKAL